MSAEELKVAVRQYADENQPGWRSAAVLILVGPFGDDQTERLLVFAAPGVTDAPALQRSA